MDYNFALFPHHQSRTKERIIPDEEKVELNQYNVYTSPKVLREVSVGKDINNGSTVVGFGIKKRIAKEGKYIGISVMQELQNDHHTYVMATYSW